MFGGMTPVSAAGETPSSLFGRAPLSGSAGHLGPVPKGGFVVVLVVSQVSKSRLRPPSVLGWAPLSGSAGHLGPVLEGGFVVVLVISHVSKSRLSWHQCLVARRRRAALATSGPCRKPSGL